MGGSRAGKGQQGVGEEAWGKRGEGRGGRSTWRWVWGRELTNSTWRWVWGVNSVGPTASGRSTSGTNTLRQWGGSWEAAARWSPSECQPWSHRAQAGLGLRAGGGEVVPVRVPALVPPGTDGVRVKSRWRRGGPCASASPGPTAHRRG